MDPNLQLSTRALHCGQSTDQWTHRALVPPIVNATSFVLDAQQLFDPKFSGNVYDYSRSGNPARDCLEQAVASLESAQYGLCFSSGMAAIISASHLLRAGDQLLCFDDIYGGSHRYFVHCLSAFGIDVRFVDFCSLSQVREALTDRTRLLWIESPSNPLMKVVDLEGLVRLRDSHSSEVLIACDNTLMSPVFQNPLKYGIDLVVHSVTKYINGHADVIMGAIMTDRRDLFDRLKFLQNALGTVPSPIDCFLANRGLKTLTVRMGAHQTNGLCVAQFLEKHPMVVQVLHPGLPSHPQHDLARRQCTGFSGMVSFRLRGAAAESREFLANLKLFKLVVSLGSVESRVELPARMSHASVPEEHKRLLGIDDSLIRLSVGIEDKSDLIADLKHALHCAQQSLNKQMTGTDSR